jgi:hypothetical protein
MAEHRPPAALVAAMTLFFAAMALCALAFWIAAVFWPGGPGGLSRDLPPGGLAIFAALHIPAAVVGVLLWQWNRRTLPARARVALEAATIYFWAVVLIGLLFNYLAASFLGWFS